MRLSEAVLISPILVLDIFVAAQKYGLQYQTILNFQPPLPLNGNLRNTSYMKQIPNYEL